MGQLLGDFEVAITGGIWVAAGDSVTGESEGVTGGSEIVVTEIRGLSESAVTMSERVVDVWQRRLTKQLPSRIFYGKRDADGTDCHAQNQGAVEAQVRMRAVV